MSDIDEYLSDDHLSDDGSESSFENEIVNKNNKTMIEGDGDGDDEIVKESEEININDSDDDEEDFIENDEDSDDDHDIHEEEEEEEEDDDIENVTKNSKTNMNVHSLTVADDDYDDENEDEDENYLQKFDAEINQSYIHEFHPECFIQNYDEIACLTRVVKNDNNMVIDPLHKTIPFLTKYEKARILGQRAKQIESGSKPFVKVPENVIDGYLIAELELQQKKIPFIIRRPLPNGGSEFWNLKDLELISF